MLNKTDIFYEFLDDCYFAAEKKQLQIFFDILLTTSEKVELVNRLNIVHELLEAKKTQREIAKDLKVSIANVSRGSNALKAIDIDLKRIFKKK